MTQLGWPWSGVDEEGDEEAEEAEEDAVAGDDNGGGGGVGEDPACEGDPGAPSLRAELADMAWIAVPTALSNALEYLPVCTGMAVVGSLPGEQGQAGLDALSLGRAFFNVTALAPVFGLVGAMRTLCPQAVGAGRPELLAMYVQQAALVMAALVLPCCGLQLFAGAILAATGQRPELAAAAGAYAVRLVPQFFGIASMVVLQRVYQAHRMVWSNLVICALGCAVAPPLQLLLVKRLGWGYLGAAWAASAYNCVFTVLQIVHLSWIGMGDLFKPRLRQALARDQMRRYLELALPSLVQSMLKWAAMELIVLVSGMLHPPERALVAASMGINILGLLLMGWIGLLVAVAVAVGRYVGAGNVRAARQAALAGVVTSGLLGAAAGLALFLDRKRVAALFTRNAGLQELSASVLQLLAGLTFMDAINNALGGIMSGLGLQRAIAVCQLVGYYAVGNPLGLAATFGYFHGSEAGVYALWGGNLLAMGASIAMQAAVLARHDWRDSVKAAMTRLYLLEEEAGGEEGDGEDVSGLRAPLLDLQCDAIRPRRRSSVESSPLPHTL